MSTRILVVSAGLSTPSSTRLLADRLAESVRQFLEEAGERVELRVIELREIATAISNHLVTGFPSPELADALAALAAADGVIAVTPIFNASYSGLFKSFFDLIRSDTLAGTPVLIAATGGSERHSLALEHAMRPLFSYLHAVVMPTSVYAASSDWGGDHDREGDLMLRVGRAARELADALGGERRAFSGPDEAVAAIGVDDDARFVPFAQLLARQGISPGR